MDTDADLDQAYDIIGRDTVPAPAPRPGDTLQQRVAELRKWLQPTDYLSPGDEFMKHLHSYAPGTGRWAQESPVLRAWAGDDTDTAPGDIQGQPSCLHVRGVAGSGKSVFAASTIRRLQESSSVVLFFFFRQIVDKNHTAKYLVRDFAAQLLPHCPALVASLTALSQEHPIVGNELDLVWPALVEALAEDSSEGVRGKVYCVVDALDEMDDEDFEDTVQKLVALGTQNPEATRVMMTSRPLPKIEQALTQPNIAHLRLDTALLSPDVERYVDARMASLEPPLSDERNDLVKKAICERASGLFLHARLVADSLAEGLQNGSITEETLPDSLDSLPRSLREVYENMLKEHGRRSGVTPEQQAKILMCVTHASRPLRLIELGSLLSRMLNLDLRRGKDLVRAGCGRLLEILQDETVSVIHHSFTEFLHDASRKDDEDAFPVLDAAASHVMLAVLSLEYLHSCPPFDATIDDTKHVIDDQVGYDCKENERRRLVCADVRVGHPLVSYAVNNLIFHLSKAAAGSVDQVLAALDRYLAPGKPAFENWILFQWDGRLSSSFNVFHLATATSHDFEMPMYVMEHYARTQPTLLDARNYDGRTPLSYAARFGYDKIVEFLLSEGADPTSGGKDGETPLHQAVIGRQVGAVRLLLDAGVDPLIKTHPVFERFPGGRGKEYSAEEAEARRETALRYAFRWDCLEVTKAFMPFIPPAEINQCFHQAREIENIEALLKMGKVDVDSFLGGMTKLSRAVESQDLDLIKLLLQHGADPNRRCVRPQFPGWEQEDVKMEIDENHSTRGATPLHFLASCGYRHDRSSSKEKTAEECVRALVDAGADINSVADERYGEDRQCLTPLHHAVQKANDDRWGWNSPDRSEEAVTEALLSAGADPNAKSGNGNTPLHLANPQKLRVLEALVKHGADVNAKNARGRTPLLEMINRLGHASNYSPSEPSEEAEATEEVVKKLLELGADVKVTDNDGDTVLHHVMYSLNIRSTPVHKALVQALLNAGMDLNKNNNKGQPPLWRYRQGDDDYLPLGADDEELFRALIDAGMDLDARDEKGQTILWLILGRPGKDLDMTKKFVRLGADPSVSRSDGTTLLHAAIRRTRSPEWLHYLISAGASPDVRATNGDTLIHSVLREFNMNSSFNEETVSLLLDVDISPLAKNNKGQSALHVARTLQNLKFVLDYPAFKELDINEPDVDGFTPLHLATELGDMAVASLLLAGADPAALTNDGLSPLHVAARHGEAGAVDFLLAKYREHGVLERHVNLLGGGRAPLHYACRAGRPESVWVLLRNGADPWLTDENGLTPLYATAEFECKDSTNDIHASPTQTADIVRMLERAGIDVNAKVALQADGDEARTRMVTALDLAVEKKCWQTVRALIDCGAVPSDEPKLNQDFFSATDKDKAAEDTRKLRQRREQEAPNRGRNGCRIESPDWRPKDVEWRGRWAASQGSNVLLEDETQVIDCGQTILDAQEEKNEDADIYGPAALSGALWDGDYDSVKEYALLGGDALVMGYDGNCTLFHYLVDWGSANLLEHFGGRISELEAQGWAQGDKVGGGTLLGRACERTEPSLHIIQLLVDKLGVDVNAVYNRRNYHGHRDEATAVHILARGDSFWKVEALEYLLTRGADINARNKHGMTPLLVAIGLNVMDGFWGERTVRLLLDHGADPNTAVQKQGKKTHGLRAVEMSVWPEITRLLLERGATLENCPGLLMRRASGKWLQPETFKLLLEAGLDPNELKLSEEKSQQDKDDKGQKEKSCDGGGFDMGSEAGCDEDEPRYPLHQAARPLTTHGYLPFDLQSRKDAVVELLLSHGADPFAQYPDGSFVLQCIVEDRGRLNTFTTRLKGMDLDRKGIHGRTFLISACVPTVPVGPKPPRYRRLKPPTVMVEAVHAFLDHGADALATDDKGRTALHWFCTLPGKADEPHREAFGALVKHGPAAINMTDNEGYKPLHLALAAYTDSSQDSTFAIRQLIFAGADPADPEPETGNTALHMIAPRLVGESAAAAEATLLFRELARSLDINGRNAAGETPVFRFAAAEWKGEPCPRGEESTDVTHAKALDVFVDLGADLVAVDSRGRTLLHVTVERERGHRSSSWTQMLDLQGAFERLMELGVDPRREDDELRSAIDLAVARELYRVVRLFREEPYEVTEADYSEFFS